MSLRIVQVPMEEALRHKLDALAQAEGKPRAEIIRKACKEYLRKIQEAELDRQYEEGYRRMPEQLSELDGFLEGYVTGLPVEDWEKEYREWKASDGTR